MPANITDPDLGAFPTTPLHKGAAESVATPDDDGDDGHYADQGTQKTQEIITTFHNRTPPRKANNSSNSSPNRTESTFTGSSGASPFLTDDDENDNKTQQQQHEQQENMYVTPPRRSNLPLLPRQSDAQSNSFAPDTDSVEDQHDRDFLYTPSVSVSTMSSAAGSPEGSYRVSCKTATEESSQEDGTSPSAAIDSGDEQLFRPPHGHSVQYESVQRGGEASTQEGPVSVVSSKDILALQASLASLQKIMSTLRGELRRRNHSEQANCTTSRTHPRSLKQQHRLLTKKSTRGLRFRERMECLILSDDKSDDDSFDSVAEEEARVQCRGVDAALTSQMVQVVRNIPQCDTANLLICLRRSQESWCITSAQVKSSSKCLDFV